MEKRDEVSEGFRRLVGPLIRGAGLKGMKMTIAMTCVSDDGGNEHIVSDMLTTGNMDAKDMMVSGALLCNICVGSNQNIEKI